LRENLFQMYGTRRQSRQLLGDSKQSKSDEPRLCEHCGQTLPRSGPGSRKCTSCDLDSSSLDFVRTLISTLDSLLVSDLPFGPLFAPSDPSTIPVRGYICEWNTWRTARVYHVTAKGWCLFLSFARAVLSGGLPMCTEAVEVRITNHLRSIATQQLVHFTDADLEFEQGETRDSVMQTILGVRKHGDLRMVKLLAHAFRCTITVYYEDIHRGGPTGKQHFAFKYIVITPINNALPGRAIDLFFTNGQHVAHWEVSCYTISFIFP